MAKILVVEDNKFNLKLFCDLLRIKKHEVLSSIDGVGVVETASTELPNLILMDIQLKGRVSGIDLIKNLKANSLTNHIPIIVITAFAMPKEQEYIIKSGCNMCLTKPISQDNFFKAVNSFTNPE